MTGRHATAIGLSLFLALLVLTSGAAADSGLQDNVSGISFYVDPTGGLLNPLRSDGGQASIENSGRIQITNHVSGQSVFQQELSWSCPKVINPDGSWTCSREANDSWPFDSRDLSPGLYDYCGIIDPGYGYSGSTTCRSYFADINKLYSYRRSHNTSSELVIPLNLDPALVGQVIAVKVSWFKAARSHHQRKGWNPPFTGWKKISSKSFQLTLQPGQLLKTGKRLINNRQVIVSFGFPQIEGTSQPGGDDTYWASASNCKITLHGAVPGPWLGAFGGKKLKRADFVGVKKPCTLRANILG